MISDTAKKYQVNDEGFLVASSTYNTFKDFKLSDASRDIMITAPQYYTFQEPLNNNAFFSGIQSKPTIEEQYSNIQEELSKLTKICNQERKERAEIQKENTKLKNENQQLIKKLSRAKAKVKSHKDELRLKDGYDRSRDDIDDLKVRMTTAEVELGIKKEGK